MLRKFQKNSRNSFYLEDTSWQEQELERDHQEVRRPGGTGPTLATPGTLSGSSPVALRAFWCLLDK